MSDERGWEVEVDEEPGGGVESGSGFASEAGVESGSGVESEAGVESGSGVESGFEPGGFGEVGPGSEPPGHGESQSGSEPELARVIEALLFLAIDPLSVEELADATLADATDVRSALDALARNFAPGQRGLLLRELAGGYTLSTDPETEPAARRLFSRPRLATLTPAQAETLAIVAYLQPISRPEITRIRGVSADSATATLLERGLIEEAGRSQFGAVLYRTTTLFLKLFGLRSTDELPDVSRWDPSPEEQAELRDRLLRAGEARAGVGPGPAIEG